MYPIHKLDLPYFDEVQVDTWQPATNYNPPTKGKIHTTVGINIINDNIFKHYLHFLTTNTFKTLPYT